MNDAYILLQQESPACNTISEQVLVKSPEKPTLPLIPFHLVLQCLISLVDVTIIISGVYNYKCYVRLITSSVTYCGMKSNPLSLTAHQMIILQVEQQSV